MLYEVITVPALIGFAVIPFGPSNKFELFGITVEPFVISDINIGILYILAFTSIGAYGIILGGVITSYSIHYTKLYELSSMRAVLVACAHVGTLWFRLTG